VGKKDTLWGLLLTAHFKYLETTTNIYFPN